MVGNGQQSSARPDKPAAGLLTAARLGAALAAAGPAWPRWPPRRRRADRTGPRPGLAGPPRGRPAAAASIAVSCTSAAHPKLAARMATGIRATLRGRSSTVALRVEDRSKQLNCSLNTRMHFDSASVVKVIILGTLLRRPRRSTGT